MSLIAQDRTRTHIRQSIGINAGNIIIGVATSTVDTTSLLDTTYLRGGDDEHNEKQVIIYDAAGSIVDGEIRVVTDYTGATNDATTSAFTATITTGDKFEMWAQGIDILHVNDLINQAISEVTQECLKDKVLATTFTERYKNEYNILSSFEAVDKVEFVDSTDEYYDLHLCDTLWDESVDSDVTVSLEETLLIEGSNSLKLVIAAGASAADILATDSISSTDISNCDVVEISVYSTVALTAGDLQLLLDNTASCASPVESLNIPATTASTWTRHIISLANPLSDTAIISIGLKMVVDKGAFTLIVKSIKAVRSTSRNYKTLAPEYWNIVKGSTAYLKLNPGHPISDNSLLRITGYQKPTLFSNDTANSDVDPTYLIYQGTVQLLAAMMKGPGVDTEARERKLRYYSALREAKLRQIRTIIRPNTRWLR